MVSFFILKACHFSKVFKGNVLFPLICHIVGSNASPISSQRREGATLHKVFQRLPVIGKGGIVKSIVSFIIPLVQIGSCILNNLLQSLYVSFFSCLEKYLLIHRSTDIDPHSILLFFIDKTIGKDKGRVENTLP